METINKSINYIKKNNLRLRSNYDNILENLEIILYNQINEVIGTSFINEK